VRARSLALALLGVALLGAAVRLLPLATFAVWGSDTGEYFRLTSTVVREGFLPLQYDGWGIAYPWFPGVYLVAGGITAMTGLEVRTTLEVLIPALAGLAAVGVALVAHHVFRSAEAAVLGGATVAVLMPHALATSHAMPGAIGHLLALGALLLVWRCERDNALWPALLLLLAALVVAHHLSTYMLMLALGGMLLMRTLLVATPRPGLLPKEHRTAWGALAVTLLLALAYWTWATPIREGVVPTQTDLGLLVLGAGAALGLGALAVLPALRSHWGWRHRPKVLPDARGLRVVGLMFVVVFAGLVAVGIVGIPGTSVTITLDALPWILPLAVLVSFAFLGTRRGHFRPQGAALLGWTLAILGSLALMGALQSVVLLPYRHAEYLLEPIAAFVGVGLAAALAEGARRGLAKPALAGVALLLAVNAAIAYPPPSVLAGFQEGTTHEEFAAVRWAGAHLALEEDAVIAADHRLSSVLFGYGGLNASWEYAPRTFHAPTFAEAEEEMREVRSPTGPKRVDYVFLADSMREGLALLQWEPARPLSPQAQAKFEGDPHYQAMCRSPTVVVYRVDWTMAGAPPATPPPCEP
jgi:hypothetical protein